MRRVSDNPPTRYPERPIGEAEHPWYVAHVKPRQEKSLADDCRRLGIEYYLPLVTHVTRRKDNNKPRKSVLPLFPGYISFAGTRETHYKLYATGRIASIITIKHQKKFIAELSQIFSLLENSVPLEPIDFSYTEGAEVRVLAGPMQGIEGIVVSIKNQHKLVLSVEGLGQAVMTIDAAMVKPIEREKGEE
jgi:transcription antitermination factor NusG